MRVTRVLEARRVSAGVGVAPPGEGAVPCVREKENGMTHDERARRNAEAFAYAAAEKLFHPNGDRIMKRAEFESAMNDAYRAGFSGGLAEAHRKETPEEPAEGARA